ncbi:MAG: hypothetical protein GXO56_03850 [Chloroflexi bacterium]|nr:hypothetical protein [Chloroflexota bacterium]
MMFAVALSLAQTATPPPPTASAVPQNTAPLTVLPLAVWGALALLVLIFAGVWWAGRSGRR